MNPTMARAANDVESGGWLVEDHHGRIVNQRAGDGDALLHARGKLVAAAMTEFVHLQVGRRARRRGGRKVLSSSPCRRPKYSTISWAVSRP